MIDKELHEAYLNTQYIICDEDCSYFLKIGEKNPLLDNFLKVRGIESWAFITAANPYSKLREESLNQQYNELLLDELQEQNYHYLNSKAIDPLNKWPTEHGYVVLDINLEAVIGFAQQFNQNAIVFGKLEDAPRLVDCLLEK